MSEKQSRIAFIYVLKDPRDSTTHYVGATVSLPSFRLSSHIKESYLRGKEQNPKYQWVQSLIKDGVYPVIEVVKAVPENEKTTAEVDLITKLIKEGVDLKNVRPLSVTKKDIKKTHDDILLIRRVPLVISCLRENGHESDFNDVFQKLKNGHPLIGMDSRGVRKHIKKFINDFALSQ